MKVLRYLPMIFCFSAFGQQAIESENYHYDAGKFISDGIALYDEENYAEAITEFEKVYKKDPSYLNATYEKLMAMEALEKKEEAGLIFDSLYQAGKFKEFPLLYINYGSWLSNQKELDKALKIFKEGHEILPYCSNLLYNYAIVEIKKENNQHAIDLLKECIDLDPKNSSALYFLGLLALDNGKLSEACLSFIASITVNPSGRFAKDMILKLNTKMAQNFNEKQIDVFSKEGDDFTELEEILRNQLPLNAKYKLKCTIDDVATRNIQAVLEYAKNHEVKNGYFEQRFIPYLAAIENKNLTEYFTYYLLVSLEETLGKQLKKQKSNVEDFVKTYIAGDFWELYSRRNDIYGLSGKLNVFYENNRPLSIGKMENGQREGKFIDIDKSGKTTAVLNYSKGMLHGEQKYYNNSGAIIEEITFENDVKEGVNTLYFSNGQKQRSQKFVKGKLEGEVTTFFPTGSKRCTTTFVNDALEGDLLCYFQNGNKQMAQKYVAGVLNGPSSYFNEAGDLISSAKYKDGKLEGEVVDYFGQNVLKSKASYVAGELSANYKDFYNNGKMQMEIIGGLNQAKKYTYYDETGLITEEYFYDKAMNLEKVNYYDFNGQMYLVEEFNKEGNMKSCMQFLTKTDKGSEVDLSKNKIFIKSKKGIKLSEGQILKGLRNKEWKYYYPNGRLKTSRTFVNGEETGISKVFDPAGRLSFINNKINGQIAGRSEKYKAGKLESIYLYNENKATGPFEVYANDKLMVDGLFENDEYAIRRDYYYTGGINNEIKYIEGNEVAILKFDPSGKKILDLDLAKLDGKRESLIGQLRIQENYKNGVKEGRYYAEDLAGDTIVESTYINDKMHGPVKYFHPSGKQSIVFNSYCGQKTGIEKFYDQMGNQRGESTYFFGTEMGTSKRFYHTGQTLSETTEFDDVMHGPTRYYSQDSQLVLVLHFSKDFIFAYQSLINGKMSDKIEIDTNLHKITSTYLNGKPAAKINISANLYHGKLEIYGKDGILDMEIAYKNGDLHGKRIEYFDNGKPYKSETFVEDDYDGEQQFFNKDGSLAIFYTMNKNNMNGDYVIYKNGKAAIVKKFDNDELVKIEKK